MLTGTLLSSDLCPLFRKTRKQTFIKYQLMSRHSRKTGHRLRPCRRWIPVDPPARSAPRRCPCRPGTGARGTTRSHWCPRGKSLFASPRGLRSRSSPRRWWPRRPGPRRPSVGGKPLANVAALLVDGQLNITG